MLYLLVMNCHMPLVLVRELDVSKLYEFTYDTVQSDIAIICTEAMKTLSFDLQIVLTEKNMTIIGDNMLLFYFQGIFVAIVFCYMNGEVCSSYHFNV